MAIVFAYTEAINKVVATGGIAGVPATFADFVTADRAGVDTVLLSAGAPANNLALTYAARPVEDLAVIVKCIVANKTALQTDYIFITGKDWRGAAQTESIDVTAGNGSYTSTKYWSEITTLDCSDNAAGGGVVWADGDLTVTQDVWGVIWDYGSGQYQLDCLFDIGGGGAPTYFQTKNEAIVQPDDFFKVVNNATLLIGEISNINYSKNGSYWCFKTVGFADVQVDEGTLEIYGSFIDCVGYTFRHYAGDLIIEDSIIEKRGDQGLMLEATLTSAVIKRTYLSSGKFICHMNAEIEDFHVENADTGFQYNVPGITTSIHNLNITNASNFDVRNFAGYIELINPKFHPNTLAISIGGDWIKEQYTCNIHTADKDGADLAATSIDCEYAHLVEGSDNKTYKCIKDHTAVDADHKPITGTDWTDYWKLYSDTENFIKPSWETGFDYKSGTAEFITQIADVNGDITEQNIQYKKWVGTTEYEEARIHKFTISKVGYEALVLDEIIVDAPIVWHMELLPQSGRVGTLIATEIDKDTANQKISVFAFDSNDGAAKTGDAANITAQISIDGGATAATNDVNPTELDAVDAPGIYVFDLTQAETNGDMIMLSAVSSTPGIRINPIMIRTKSYIERLSQRHHGV